MADPIRYVPDRHASFDLHLHTHWSYDALADVEAHFARASELGLRCIAITEHHVLDSQDEVRQVSLRYPSVRWIRAAELSATTSIGSIDFVCYGLPPEATPALAEVLEDYHAWQRACGAALQRGVLGLGYDYTEAEHHRLIDSYRPAKATAVQGYTHVRNGTLRRHFIDRGFIAAPEEYLELRRRASEVVPLPPYPSARKVLPALHDAGAVVGIAHPRNYFRGADRQRMDALRDECGLNAIECAHPGVPPELTPVYRAYCVEHGLLSVGGSDCHTPEDVGTVFARHLGEDEWLDELLERLGPA